MQAVTVTPQAQAGIQPGGNVVQTRPADKDVSAQGPATVPADGDSTADAIDLANGSDEEPDAKKAKLATDARNIKVIRYAQGMSCLLCLLFTNYALFGSNVAYHQTAVCSAHPYLM